MGLRRIILALLFEVGIGGYAAHAQPEFPKLAENVRAASFPQLKGVDIAFHPMRSDYIYFESRFTFSSFFLARELHYLIRFNPEAIVRQVPPDGLQAIMAHELAHIDYFHRRRRIALVSLFRLLSARFTVRFERGADLKAIALGYGPGLESYRTWLYRNVPANKIERKKRDYFSPEEIEAILLAARQNPQIISIFSACVPRNLAEIERQALNPGARCAR
jgi:integrase